MLLEVGLHAESSLDNGRVKDLLLLLGVRLIFSHFDREGILVRIIVQVDEAIVKQETRIAFLAVGVVDLLTALNVLQCLDDEALAFIRVSPAGLARTLVIKHISIRNKAVCLNTLNVNAKDATSDHHANLRVLLQTELTVVLHLVANGVVVLLDVPDLFTDLVLEGATFEPRSLLLRVENGEVIEGLGQDIDVLIKE